MAIQGIQPCLWFDTQGEEAANFYVGIFPNSRIKATTYYGKAGFEFHGRAEGSVMTVEFELDGKTITALNGGPIFKFNEAISFQILCDTQEEIDYYWEKLNEGGDPNAQACGWLKDKFGLSWQVTPAGMAEFFHGAGGPGSERAMAAMMTMKKIDLAELCRARAGA